jgi:Holliday junction resolvase
MPTPESKVKDKVVKILKKYSVYYFFPATHGYGRSGVPDIIACFNAQFVAIECKAGKGELTALQKRELSRIAVAGGKTFAVNENTIHRVEEFFAPLFDDDRC